MLTGDRFGREVYHDSLRSSRSSARRQRRYFMHPMMMEFYEGMIDDSLSSESESSSDEEKKKSDRDDRRRGRGGGPDRMMMMMMMMGGGGGGGGGGPDDDGPELDGLDDEERDFVMNELPRMMSYGRRSRHRRRGDRRRRSSPSRRRLTPYEAEREKYENHFNPATTTSLTFHVVAAADDDWPSYTDASDMGYPRRRAQGGRSSAFFPFDMMPDFVMRRRGASPDDHEDPFADSFDVDVATAAATTSTPKRLSPANKEPDVLSSMTALSAIQKKKDDRDVDGVAVETTGKDDEEEDRVRKSAAKLARSKKRKAMLISLRKKAGIYKPGDVYPLVPDWHYMCMLLHPPSDAWTFEHDEELARFITKELEPSRGALTVRGKLNLKK